ncbi:MAG: LysM repeat protein [Planctomycetota bacterium]|jgi:LysM repeat protein
MFAHFFAGCLIALAGIPAAPARTADAAPLPDVVVPGTRSITAELRIEARPLLDHCCVQHVIVKGETLSKLALTHREQPLITTVKEIIALNPGLNPDKLAVGQRIWMPPKLTWPGTENTFVFLDQGRPIRLGRAFAPADKARAPRRGGTSFLLVPESMIAAYHAAKKSRDWQDAQTILKSKKVQVLSCSSSGGSVWDESPVYSCKDTIKIERSKKGVFSAKLTSVAYNKAGDIVPPSEREKDHRKNKKGMWFLLLPFVGGGWLLWRTCRQRSSATEQRTR